MDAGDDIAMKNARRGDRGAFRVPVERHAKAVFRLAYRMNASEIDAEDIVQETFLKAWKQIGKFDGRASFATWPHRICANCSLDLIRARIRTPLRDCRRRRRPRNGWRKVRGSRRS